jgi:hypothetical protein
MFLDEKSMREQMIKLFNEAFKAIAEKDRLLVRVKRLEAQNEMLSKKAFASDVLLRGYRAVSGIQIGICPQCDGSGAYMIGKEVEECTRCDTLGWEEKTTAI